MFVLFACNSLLQVFQPELLPELCKMLFQVMKSAFNVRCGRKDARQKVACASLFGSVH